MHALFTEWFIYSNSFHKGMGELLYILSTKYIGTMRLIKRKKYRQKKEMRERNEKF